MTAKQNLAQTHTHAQNKQRQKKHIDRIQCAIYSLFIFIDLSLVKRMQGETWQQKQECICNPRITACQLYPLIWLFLLIITIINAFVCAICNCQTGYLSLFLSLFLSPLHKCTLGTEVKQSTKCQQQ